MESIFFKCEELIEFNFLIFVLQRALKYSISIYTLYLIRAYSEKYFEISKHFEPYLPSIGDIDFKLNSSWNRKNFISRK